MAVPRALGFVEKVYLVEVLKGLGITIGHLLHNIWDQAFNFDHPASRVIEYPDVKKVMPERYKGAHRLTQREDGKVKCVACMCCQTVCPARCITIQAGEYDDGDAIEKYPVRFEIDMLRCIYCGFCVEACPKDAIRMDSGIYEINAFTRQELVHSKSYMTNLLGVGPSDAIGRYADKPDEAPVGYDDNQAPVVGQ